MNTHNFEQLQTQVETLCASVRTTTHHINQHLTVIMGEAQLLQDEPDASSDMQESLERIITAAEQARKKLALMRQTVLDAQPPTSPQE
jgi:hypothetical protein